MYCGYVVLIQLCIVCVLNLSRDNFSVQERLFDRMDDLLQLDVAIPEMADVLTEVSVLLLYLHSIYKYASEVYRYGNFGSNQYPIYLHQIMPIPINCTDIDLTDIMQYQYSLQVYYTGWSTSCMRTTL